MANKLFSTIPLKVPKKNRFNLSHMVKTTGEMGVLYPVLCEPVLPGERWKVGTEQLMRMAPMQAPLMADVDIYMHAFFVPSRILWSNWETFITGSNNGFKVEEDEMPEYPLNDVPASMVLSSVNDEDADGISGNNVLTDKSLYDYLGFQTYNKSDISSLTGSGAFYPVDDLPFRCYAKIYDDYYRDENLDTEAFPQSWMEEDRINPSTNASQYNSRRQLRRRSWAKDYFTSALPFAQKGDDVLLPLQGTASVIGENRNIDASRGSSNYAFQSLTGSPASSGPLKSVASGPYVDLVVDGHEDNYLVPNPYSVAINASALASSLSVDLSTASAATIRELRRAYAAQRFLERRAVGGTRYGEQNRAMFGAKIIDGRLQRAEFLGGMKQPVVVSQVLQTSQTTEGNPLATPAGTATSIGGKFLFNRTFHEYGYIMVIMSVMPKADYSQGIPRKYLRQDPYEYYWPQFARIGEQDIKNCELFFNWKNAGSIHNPSGSYRNFETFGYTPRYAEYRFNNNRVGGDFKNTLSFWTLARRFSNNPQLNSTFIKCNPNTDIWAVEDTPFHHLWFEIKFNISALRPMPKYGEAL